MMPATAASAGGNAHDRECESDHCPGGSATCGCVAARWGQPPPMGPLLDPCFVGGVRVHLAAGYCKRALPVLVLISGLLVGGPDR